MKGFLGPRKFADGDQVKKDQVVFTIEPETYQTAVDQKKAQLDAARAALANAETQKRRSDELFKSQSITEQELETAALAVANARAEVVNGQVAVENARIRMDDTDVLAPINGTVISKSVERGQITLHPGGIPHGPHPGTVEKSIGKKETLELAVMVDTFRPLKMTEHAEGIEDGEYYRSWLPS